MEARRFPAAGKRREEHRMTELSPLAGMGRTAAPCDPAHDWVDRTLDGMGLSDRIGQLLFPILSRASLEHEGFEGSDIEGFCREFGIGGGHLFGGNLEEVRAWTDRAQSGVSIPLLISGDLDRGGGNRISGGELFPYQMALGAADSEERAYELGKCIALESRLAGYNWALGPIVDLCSSRDYARHIASIGENPEQVARLACAEVRGIQDHGMAACAKHYPGDGHDDRDQHLVTLTNPLDAESWWNQSAVPFRACIHAGVYSIMASGIALPSLEAGCSPGGIPMPAVFSKILIQGVLRGKMGFDGVVVTDALNMGGMSCHFPLFERYLRAFMAGNDALLFVRNLGEVRSRFLRAVDEGIITEAQIEASVRRILMMKAKLRLADSAGVEDGTPGNPGLGSAPVQESARLLAESSITLLRDRLGQFPPVLPARSEVAHVLITNREKEINLAVFNRELEAEGHRVETLVNPDAEAIYDRVAAGCFDLLIVSFYYPIQWGWGTTRCHGPHIRSIMSGFYRARPGQKALFISMGSPFHLQEMPFMDPFMVTYGESPCLLRAAALMVLGKIPTLGRIPVGLEGYFKRGEGIISCQKEACCAPVSKCS